MRKYQPVLAAISLLFLLLSSSSVIAGDKVLKRMLTKLGIEQLHAQPAPDFTLLTFSGDSLTLQSFGSRTLILHFWASWCVPCLDELPELERFSNGIDDTSFAMLGISIDKASDSLKILHFLDRADVTFDNAAAYTGRISKAYWSWGVPVTYFIDPDGVIVGRLRGPGAWRSPEMRELLLYLANKQSSTEN